MLGRWQFVCLVLSCCSCAGKLRDPERFQFLVGREAGSGASAGKAGTDAMAAVPPAPACAVTLFKNSCGLSVCHAANTSQIDLLSPDVASRLVGKASAAGGSCAGRTLVTSDGSSSLLVDKLAEPPPCGARMPLGGNPISPDDLKCITDWVSLVNGGKG